jgi:hypothetical protein
MDFERISILPAFALKEKENICQYLRKFRQDSERESPEHSSKTLALLSLGEDSYDW